MSNYFIGWVEELRLDGRTFFCAVHKKSNQFVNAESATELGQLVSMAKIEQSFSFDDPPPNMVILDENLKSCKIKFHRMGPKNIKQFKEAAGL